MNSTMKNNSMKTTRGQRNNNPLNIRKTVPLCPSKVGDGNAVVALVKALGCG